MKDLTRGSIYKNMIWFAVPLVLSGLLSQGFNLMDTVIAGQFLGTDGLAALGATSAYIYFVSSLLWGYETGLGLYVGQLFGAKRYADIKAVVYANLVLMFVIMLGISALSVVCVSPLLSLLQVDPHIVPLAKTYFLLYMAGFPLIVFNVLGVCLLNAFGSSGYPFFMSIFCAVLNVIGNLLSVTVWDFGVAGIAASTVLSAGVVDVCYAVKLHFVYREMGVSAQKNTFSFARVREAAPFTLPTAFQQGVMYLARLIVSPIVNGLGDAATAAYAVVLQIYNICSSIYFNSVKALTSHTAQCVGAGKIERAKKGLLAGFLQNALFLTPFLFVCVAFAEPVSHLFFKADADPDALAYVLQFMRFFLPFAYLNLAGNVFHGFFKALGAKREVISATVAGAVMQVVASFALSYFFGMTGVYAGWILAWAVDSGYGAWLYWRGYWKKRIPVLQRAGA